MKPPVKYCAVYTRKSTEEGLEQEFNTLNTQRANLMGRLPTEEIEDVVRYVARMIDQTFEIH